jgi:hypothetical protein
MKTRVVHWLHLWHKNRIIGNLEAFMRNTESGDSYTRAVKVKPIALHEE